MVRDFDPFDFLHLLTRRCVSLLDVDQAGLLLAGPDGNLQLMAASHEAARPLELLQLQAREGPCLDSCATGTQVISNDLVHDVGRWPRFAPKAIQLGHRAVVAVEAFDRIRRFACAHSRLVRAVAHDILDGTIIASDLSPPLCDPST